MKSILQYIRVATKGKDAADGLLYRHRTDTAAQDLIFQSPQEAVLWHFEQDSKDELDQLINDLLVTAFEGGSNYWIDHVEVKGDYNGYASDQITKGKIITIYGEDGKWELDRSKMIKGIAAFMGHEGKSLVDLMDDHDAGDADTILQFAILNEIVYG